MMARRIVVAMLVVFMALAGIVSSGSEAIAQYKGGSAYKPPPPAYKPPQAYKPQTRSLTDTFNRSAAPPKRSQPLVKPQRQWTLPRTQQRQTTQQRNMPTTKVLPYKQRPKLFGSRATPGSPQSGKTSRPQLTDQQKQARKDRLAILRAKPLPPRSGGGKGGSSGSGGGARGGAGSGSQGGFNRPRLTQIFNAAATQTGSAQKIPLQKQLSISNQQRSKLDKLNTSSRPRPADSVHPLPNLLSWSNPATLRRHFEEHGKDFGAKDQNDYANMASTFLQNSQRDKLQTKIDKNVVIRVYDKRTNTFGSYNPDGTTRTFFKPTSPTYFDRQPGSPPTYTTD